MLSRIAPILLIVILFASGCAERRGFSFVTAADMRGYAPPRHPGSSYFLGVCEAIRDVGPGDFMICPGDFDPPARVRATLDQVLGADYVWYPVVGNHELDKPEDMPWLREYNAGGDALPGVTRVGPPGAVETCYSFDHKNAHFVVLNQYYDGQSDTGVDGDMADALYEWLAEDLRENDKPLVFVAGHEPTVSMPDLDNGRVRHRGDSLDKYPERNHRFWALLRQYGVVAYFCGHTHNTSVAKINGVWQIDCGHARGLGDTGARSSFIRIMVDDDNSVTAEVYRGYDQAQRYELTYTEKLQ